MYRDLQQAGDYTPDPAAARSCPPRRLQDLQRGQRIRLVADSVPTSHRPLLEAMGLCSDCELQVCQSKGTCILDMGGSRLGLSESVASSILAVEIHD